MNKNIKVRIIYILSQNQNKLETAKEMYLNNSIVLILKHVLNTKKILKKLGLVKVSTR